MANKFVAIINNLKLPKIKKILLYKMKRHVPNYCRLQNPWLGGYRPQISVLCPQLNLFSPPTRTKFLGMPLVPALQKNHCYQIRGVSHVMVLVDISLSSEIYAKHTNTFIFVKPAVSALLKHMLHPLSVVLWGITGRWPGVWDISTLHSKLSPREEIVTCAHAHGLVNAKPLYI